MIADPNDGPRTCSRCLHRYACPTPQVCEQAEEERTRSRWRDYLVAAALAVALAAVPLILSHWSS